MFSEINSSILRAGEKKKSWKCLKGGILRTTPREITRKVECTTVIGIDRALFPRWLVFSRTNVKIHDKIVNIAIFSSKIFKYYFGVLKANVVV